MTKGWHFIEHDLTVLDADVKGQAADGISELEALLAKHAAFEDYCRDRDRRP